MIRFEVGQEVYHTRFGRGVVLGISNDDPPIISVDFFGEPKDLVYDKNLLLRMTIRKPVSNQKSIEESKSKQDSSRASFFSSLVLPSEVEIKQFEGMDRFHFKYMNKGFLVIDLKNNGYQLRTREDYLKAIGIEKYELDYLHTTNPAKIRTIPYSDTNILRRLIEFITSKNMDYGINIEKAPLRITKTDGKEYFVCPTCESTFKKAKRCPECGQLINFVGNSAPQRSKRILHVGDNVSNMKIYEIINKFFGESYNGWMKASYEINNEYWAWFPTITKTNTRPNGSYGGTAMWSNVLSDDRRTVISTNHDEPNKIYEASDKKVLIFARIDWQFVF